MSRVKGAQFESRERRLENKWSRYGCQGEIKGEAGESQGEREKRESGKSVRAKTINRRILRGTFQQRDSGCSGRCASGMESLREKRESDRQD